MEDPTPRSTIQSPTIERVSDRTRSEAAFLTPELLAPTLLARFADVTATATLRMLNDGSHHPMFAPVAHQHGTFTQIGDAAVRLRGTRETGAGALGPAEQTLLGELLDGLSRVLIADHRGVCHLPTAELYTPLLQSSAALVEHQSSRQRWLLQIAVDGLHRSAKAITRYQLCDGELDVEQQLLAHRRRGSVTPETLISIHDAARRLRRR